MLTLRKLFLFPLIATAVVFAVGILAFPKQELAANNLNFLYRDLPPIATHKTSSAIYSLFPTAANTYDSQVAALVNQVSSAVVSIYGYKQTVAQPDNGFVVPFLNVNLSFPSSSGGVQRIETTAGSGFFISPNGYILTNNHVVSDPGETYSVDLSDGSVLPAQVVYTDPSMDLAVVKIEGSNYPTVTLGDSSEVQVGEAVMSLGNAFGRYQNLLSAGDVTDLHQNIEAQDDNGNNQTVYNLIQTDEQLYPGDSGGPTFDLSGKVIGVNVAVATNVDNMSFSIPINSAKSVIDSFANK